MRINPKKGFIIILVIVSLSVLILSASMIVTIGCGELMATRVRNDMLVSAYYVAISGCELKYADIKSSAAPKWGVPLTGSVAVGSSVIGTYSATATDLGSNTFAIVSIGTVNGRTATVTEKLGYLVDYDGPLALGAYGAVSLISGSNPAKIKMEGPAASSTTEVYTEGNVTISGDPDILDNTGVPKVSFWPAGVVGDTNGNGTIYTDADGSNSITSDEAGEEQAAAFALDDVYPPSSPDGVADEKDAFYYYYTTILNYPGTLYYTGDQIFDSNDIDDSVPMIFVDGNCTITENDGATTDHTVVVTGDLTLHQPTNESGDRNTYVVYGNVTTDGEMGHGGGTIGDLIIFANGDITKSGGGKMNASFYSNGTLTIDTGSGAGKMHLMLSRLTATDLPIGLPSGYPIRMTSGFTVKNQTDYPPVWQRK
ncbi:MAG: hypothetical protein KKH77_02885 [Candidatus Omnitrophica bacterium]|nr:hypothetical protein [Candidatus Omnitrophota bacterium]MBU0881058.1 hypothetical protein [Candidatus Omnitrophota bacterium]MBU0895337.1 hypothetical protein [Candidatus Omnitrophota bacterium]MBU1807976.1 hypothetical protein [Candidatus Omnitrophota bacterium]